MRLRGIALELGDVADGQHAHAVAAVAQDPSRDKPIPAIIAAARHHTDRSPNRASGDNRIRHCRPGALHEIKSECPTRNGHAIGGAHLRIGQKFDHCMHGLITK